MAWLGFAALAWSLWNARNKALMEGLTFKRPADSLSFYSYGELETVGETTGPTAA